MLKALRQRVMEPSHQRRDAPSSVQQLSSKLSSVLDQLLPMDLVLQNGSRDRPSALALACQPSQSLVVREQAQSNRLDQLEQV